MNRELPNPLIALRRRTRVRKDDLLNVLISTGRIKRPIFGPVPNKLVTPFSLSVNENQTYSPDDLIREEIPEGLYFLGGWVIH